MNHTVNNATLKAQAREILLGKYKTVVFAYVLMQSILSLCLSFVDGRMDFSTLSGISIYYGVYFIVFLLSAIFVVGQNRLYLSIFRNQPYQVGQIWEGFRLLADRSILCCLHIFIKTIVYAIPFFVSFGLYLSTQNKMLLPVAGIFLILYTIAAIIINIDYSQTYYLIWDLENASPKELLEKSRTLMKGNRARYFRLVLSFCGIFLLSLITCGLSAFWAYPYFTATKTAFYLQLYPLAVPKAIDLTATDKASDSIL